MQGSVPAVVAEAIGTFLFFFIAAGAALLATGDPASALLVVALAHGVVLAVLVSSFGAVSGGHFNPAVTLGLLLAGKTSVVRFPPSGRAWT
jgi:glycerol uptake facilitator-like aquaporin